MNNNKLVLYVLLLSFFSGFLIIQAREQDSGNKQLSKTNTNDFYTYIACNQFLMYIGNNGSGSHNPITDGAGAYWPGGENATISCIFQDGLIWGGKIGREIRMNGDTHRLGLQAGKILENGTADDPSLSKYRVYKIRKDWESLPPGTLRDALEKDLEEWPVDDGAPWEDLNGNGTYDVGEAQFIGDEVLWYVANDLDPTRSTRTYGSQPIGLEQQCTTFGFKRTGDLGDIVFKKYKMINKSQNNLTDTYFGMWTDTDLGDGYDDYTGCDTILSLGYTWNGDNVDAGYYVTPPPALGYDFFQGPVIPYDPATYPIITQKNLPDSAKFLGKWIKGKTNLPMTAFTFYINANDVYKDPTQGSYTGTIEFYNYLQGKVWDGSDFIDPNTGKAALYVLSGDPVAGTGWYEGKGWPGGFSPGDRRHLMCSGPFTLAPGDTQEVVVGIIVAKGTSNLNSITELKRKDLAAQIAYDLDFKITASPEQPKLHALPQNNAVTLWWEQNAENYDAANPILPDQLTVNVSGRDTIINVTDKNYAFQGYRVWQYSDLAGSNPELIAVYDIKDGIGDIYNYQYDLATINGEVKNPDVLISAPDEGIRRFHVFTSSAYTNGALYNGNPYYFGVTAYGYNKYSDPPYLESTPNIIEVRPETKEIDYSSPYEDGEGVVAEHTSGTGDGKVTFKLIDPQALTGDHYKVVIKGNETTSDKRYDLINTTTNDTLLQDMTDFVRYNALADTINHPVIEGFQIFVRDIAKDTLDQVTTKYVVKNVLEVKGPNGVALDEPMNVFGNYNSTGKWTIKAKGSQMRLNWQQNKKDAIGYTYYEVRFPMASENSYSPFFVTGYFVSFISPALKNDPIAKTAAFDAAKNTYGISLPFEIWDVGRDDATFTPKRLTVKTLDFDKDDASRAIRDTLWSQLPNGDWEDIFALETTKFPADTLPATSGLSVEADHRFGNFVISGEVPAPGTVIKITTYKPLEDGDVYESTLTAANFNDKDIAKSKLKDINVFPNPYFGANSLERDKYQRFVRFTNLPTNVTLRIYSLAGIFIRKLDKSDNTQWLDWDLKNTNGLPVSSGMYIAYLDMPGIGTKVLKLAVIAETQYIDRL